MNEKQAYIEYIVKMLERCVLRKVKLIYEFVLGATD